MKNKDKQIGEFEKNEVIWMIIAFVGWSLFLIIIMLGLNTNKDLEQQLESCKEKVPVWTLRVYCEAELGFGIERKIIDYETSNYKQYLSLIKIAENTEECKVIE